MAEQRAAEVCGGDSDDAFLCATAACEVALRKNGLVSDDERLRQWVGRMQQGTLLAESVRDARVSYWACQVAGATVSRVYAAKESEAQPYFSTR
jgi:hypothetical protein